MKEFMFFIRKRADSKETLSPVKHTEFLKSCQTYIETLRSQGKLITAQPIERSGEILSFSGQEWARAPFNESNEVIGGYYHIHAENLEEAVSIAMKNPEFEFNPGTRIEVRPLKMKEESTGYVYPSN